VRFLLNHHNYIETYVDKCWDIDGQTLLEYYCEGNFKRDDPFVKCEYGCSDGACLQNKPECFDSDPQNSLTVKGYATIDNGKTKIYDECGKDQGYHDKNMLIQFYCDGSTLKSKFGYSCPYGCTDGACLSAPSTNVTPTTCSETSWSPLTSTICNGQTFTQTSNCGTTRNAVGIKTTGECATTPTTTTISSLTNNVATIISGTKSSETFYQINVPAGATNLKVELTYPAGATGDADLYVKYGSNPTTLSYDCRPYKAGTNNEACPLRASDTKFSNPSEGNWYVLIRGYKDYSGVNLKASYDIGSQETPTNLQLDSPKGLSCVYNENSKNLECTWDKVEGNEIGYRINIQKDGESEAPYGKTIGHLESIKQNRTA